MESSYMPPRIPIDAFLEGGGPLVDVRAPAEFKQGHIPGAVNMPLFTDEERVEVGTLYKRNGHQAAVRRGLTFVHPRLEYLSSELITHSERSGGQPLRLHCWRGGMRSSSVAWLAQQLDLPAVTLESGYKSYRRWVLAQFDRPWPQLHLLG